MLRPPQDVGEKGRAERGAGAGPAGRHVTAGAGGGGTGGAARGVLRYGHLQRLRGEQGWRPHLPAGPLRAPRRHREDLQLSTRPRPAPARRARRGRLRAAGRHPRWVGRAGPGAVGLLGRVVPG